MFETTQDIYWGTTFDCNNKDERVCFLTHSPKEELEEIKEKAVLSVSPEQRML